MITTSRHYQNPRALPTVSSTSAALTCSTTSAFEHKATTTSNKIATHTSPTTYNRTSPHRVLRRQSSACVCYYDWGLHHITTNTTTTINNTSSRYHHTHVNHSWHYDQPQSSTTTGNHGSQQHNARKLCNSVDHLLTTTTSNTKHAITPSERHNHRTEVTIPHTNNNTTNMT